ncbi:MAG: M1 family metallopeptidase [Stygiobacter sp.]
MKKINLLLLLISFFTSFTFAQKNSLYIPRNVLKAYEKETRSFDGKPGKNYWINKADYKIKAELIPAERKVIGSEFITYHNESPDSLNQIVIRLYQDVMKKGSARDFSVNPVDLTDGVQLDTIIIFNGKELNIKDKNFKAQRSGTNLFIRDLPQTIAPKSKATFEIKWSMIIPKETRIRMGAYNDSTFYVAYWYPQISVYDDIDGWDRFDYGGAVEFYNDINNFDVEITVPKNYIVWGSGLYQNADKILKPEIFERYKKAWTSDEIINVITEEDLKNGTTISSEKNTWHLIGENIADFSWATSSGYLWDATSVEVDNNGRRVLTDAVYPIESKQKGWNEVALFAKLAVQALSTNSPAVPFPFPKVTTFNGETHGGGGMEIPMMCNNGVAASRGTQAGVTLHEIAHSYFPFYMGTNERKYAWMDEGWATFFTSDNIHLIIEQEIGEGFERNINGVGMMMGNELDLPTISPSISARGQMLTFATYVKSSSAYYFLRDAIGKDLFDKAMKEYINRWNGKHPIPYDFFFTFNDVVKEDLSWFFKPWFFEYGFPDLAVKNVVSKNKKKNIIIEKVGNVPVPIELEITYKDGSKEKVYKNTSVWKNGIDEYSIQLDNKKEIQKVELITKRSSDANAKNNIWEKK